MKGPSRLVGMLLGVVGAVVGGVVGCYAFRWMLDYGLYAIVLPGTLVGLGFGLCSRQKCVLCGIACGVAGIVLGAYVEWRFVTKFIADKSFYYFITHLHLLPPVTLVLIGLGGLFSFWFGMGRDAERVGVPPLGGHE